MKAFFIHLLSELIKAMEVTIVVMIHIMKYIFQIKK